jgi:hypothetical protein
MRSSDFLVTRREFNVPLERCISGELISAVRAVSVDGVWDTISGQLYIEEGEEIELVNPGESRRIATLGYDVLKNAEEELVANLSGSVVIPIKEILAGHRYTYEPPINLLCRKSLVVTVANMLRTQGVYCFGGGSLTISTANDRFFSEKYHVLEDSCLHLADMVEEWMDNYPGVHRSDVQSCLFKLTVSKRYSAMKLEQLGNGDTYRRLLDEERERYDQRSEDNDIYEGFRANHPRNIGWALP